MAISSISSISSGETKNELYPKDGGSEGSLIDHSEETWWYGKVTEDKPVKLEIQLTIPSNIDRIKISSDSRIPIDIDVSCITIQNSSRIDIRGNTSNEVIIDIPREKCRNQKIFEITVYKTQESDHLMKINELYVQRKNSVYQELINNMPTILEIKRILLFAILLNILVIVVDHFHIFLSKHEIL